MPKYSFKVFDFDGNLIISMILNKEDIFVFSDIYDSSKFVKKVYRLNDESEVN